ncbi:sodium/glutamate symporter [Dethiosulfovibrio salsuginis]|uniref:Sodium/glutamate symporter n=1 Tax=Dethiosulfovibrio salsuginis TaxID=561720 RepID=A0A1X7JKV7_9BACT|nr:sodium/glutamate symporter [Dethiosulfovibrio salsuginis]SMG28822.1 glutamate:Na+ symporter, ESS family [Dethiosulfovibrio salsuginis]
MILKFDLIGTVAVASLVLWCGLFIRDKITPLKEYNIPAPVIGGILFALLRWTLLGKVDFEFEMILQSPLMIAFFTTVGLGASLKLLKKGGPQVLLFLGLASILVTLQNVVAAGVAKLTGLHPLLGLLAGSVTMSGGHGTGATFARTFTLNYGLVGAMELAMAAATFGLVAGSIIGGPVARRLIRKYDLKPDMDSIEGEDGGVVLEHHGHATVNDVLITILQISCAMYLGALAYGKLMGLGITLPTYLCALFVGIVIRNVSDFSGLYKVHLKCVDYIGSVALSLFLAMALMSLKLWQLMDLAGPMIAILLGETALMAFFATFITFPLMGKDFEAAIMAGGHCGFGMGATPNAVANMEALSSHYGPAPRAFFVIPIVGAFFIDIVNAFVIQGFAMFLS